MSNYTIAAGARAVHRKVTTASTVDVVSLFDVPDGTADDMAGRLVEVLSDGGAELFVRADGVAPVVDGPATFRFPAGAVSMRELRVFGNSVQLVSPGSATYSVTIL